MKELNEQIKEVRENWKEVYASILNEPDLWQPHLKPFSPQTIDEVVSTISHWLDRVRAPNGFAPTFHVAKGLCGLGVANALSALENLQQKQQNYLASFVSALNQIINAIYLMIIFSDKHDQKDVLDKLGGNLTESLALLDTAQKELSGKVKQLDAADESLEKVNEGADSIDELLERSKTSLEALEKNKEAADGQKAEIDGMVDEISELKASLQEQINRNTEYQGKLDKYHADIQAVIKRHAEQQKLISDLLPKAASAGLAASFNKRVRALSWVRWSWLGLFVASLSALGVFAFLLLGRATDAVEFVPYILQRLPLSLPFVWLGWFSAIQYGNVTRVQEDYAFKEATSMAFVGYKDHMEYMAKIDADDADDAMKMLAIKTISILSNEPLRIYGKNESDASPLSSWFKFLSRSKGADEQAS